MIPLKIQMFSFTELVELLGWVDKGVPLFFYHPRCSCICIPISLKKNFGEINLFILIQEEAYVEFLRIRRVPLQGRKFSDDASDVVTEVTMISFLFSSTVFHFGNLFYIFRCVARRKWLIQHNTKTFFRFDLQQKRTVMSWRKDSEHLFLIYVRIKSITARTSSGHYCLLSMISLCIFYCFIIMFYICHII